VSLRARLIAILCATAAIATALALAFQDRTLARDLESAAAARLERSATAANTLVDAHLSSLLERYRAVSGTPQLRANLEVEDPPTLAHYAEELRSRSSAVRIAFVDLHGRLVAASGDTGLDSDLLYDDEPRLLARAGQLFALASIEIGARDDAVGRLLVAEPIPPETLERWGELCGASIVVGPVSGSTRNGSDDPDALERTVRSVGGGELRVESRLAAERAALHRSRVLLIVAGLIALAGALGASLVLSRGLVSAMRDLLGAAERIGQGDLTVRLAIDRNDEVGEVARAVNEMAQRLETNASALHEQHVDLIDAKDRAEEASRAKTDFLANVSHEIRTPMTAVLGYTDLLLTGAGDATEREVWAAAVRRNGAQLLDLIDGILDVSRLEGDRLEIQRRTCGLRDLVEPVAATARAEAHEKGLAFHSEIGDGCPEAIDSDPVRLRQILSNLLRNAVKFTSSGSVSMRVSRASDTSTKLVFEVTDSGVGIPATDFERIFAPFGQVDASHTRRFGGAGLGLAISRRLAKLLGGTLAVSSEPGRGSTFRLEIEAPAAARAASDPPSRRARVLLAEDGTDNQRLIRALLRPRADVVLVENGAQALAQALAALDAGEPFDLVLMDMQMPVMDGYEATLRLRESGYTAPIVALTAHAMSGDRERCLAAGCDEYLTKPIDRARLLECLATFALETKPGPAGVNC
jgi:signal transduction histidine kinase/ActR/RegA family two-component response regulator